MGKPTISPDAVAQDQLKAFVRRIEALDDEIKVLNEDKSEVYAESKANGFDNKILRKVVAERRKGAAEREEQDALFQLYWDAIHGVAHAHVEIIEEFPPHDADGVVLDEIAGNGAGGAEDQAQVANSRASSSANSSLAKAAHAVSRATTNAERQPQVETGKSGDGEPGRHDSASADADPALTPPPAEGNTPTSAGHGDESATHAAALVVDPIAHVDADAGVDRSGPGAPSLDSPAPVANVIALRTHNPDTHFLNSAGLVRLHGCLKPENCGSSEPRKRLCFNCSVQHDGPTFQDGVA